MGKRTLPRYVQGSIIECLRVFRGVTEKFFFLDNAVNVLRQTIFPTFFTASNFTENLTRENIFDIFIEFLNVHNPIMEV